MCLILRVILHRLWIISTFILLLTFLIYWFYGILISSVVLSFGIMGILYNAQDLLLYYPNDPPDSRVFVMEPNHFKLPYESIMLKTKDGLKIHIFLILQATDSDKKPTLIFFHGNAGNMGQRLTNASGFYNELNMNVLLVEYRGYGLSEGSPSEQGLYIDAQTAFEYIMQRDDIDRSKVVVFGRSLGGAIAIDLASRPEYKDHIWVLIVENTFTSIPDMARVVLRWKCLKWLPMFCHKNKFYSATKMRSVNCSTLIVCGALDVLVPPSMSCSLMMHCRAPVRLMVTLQGGHDDTWSCSEYYSELGRFLLLAPPPNPREPIPFTIRPDVQIV